MLLECVNKPWFTNSRHTTFQAAKCKFIDTTTYVEGKGLRFTYHTSSCSLINIFQRLLQPLNLSFLIILRIDEARLRLRVLERGVFTTREIKCIVNGDDTHPFPTGRNTIARIFNKQNSCKGFVRHLTAGDTIVCFKPQCILLSNIHAIYIGKFIGILLVWCGHLPIVVGWKVFDLSWLSRPSWINRTICIRKREHRICKTRIRSWTRLNCIPGNWRVFQRYRTQLVIFVLREEKWQ